MTPIDLTIKMLRPYIERGDTIQDTKAGQMGSFGSDGYVQIGGYANGKHYSTDYVVVSKVGNNECLQVFKLKDIYDRVLTKQVSLI